QVRLAKSGNGDTGALLSASRFDAEERFRSDYDSIHAAVDQNPLAWLHQHLRHRIEGENLQPGVEKNSLVKSKRAEKCRLRHTVKLRVERHANAASGFDQLVMHHSDQIGQEPGLTWPPYDEQYL